MQSTNSFHSLFLCPKNDKTVYALIFVITVISSLLIIANPGFFSHDEWDKADYITRYGFAKYVSDYVSLPVTVEFGHPVRPISFFIQGVAALFMHSYPFVVHLMDVLMHGAVAAMLFVAIRRVNESRQFAWVSTLIFLISPLAALSVAWSAALMDRLYILFGLIAFIAAYDYIKQKREWVGLLAIFIASSMAILSKETALILPAILIVLPLFALVPLRNKRLWIAFAVWCIPIGMYLLYRAPALANSISGAASSPYSVSLFYVPDGLAVYAIYPFLWLLIEPGNWHLQMAPRIWFAAIAHAVLLVMLWRAFSFRVVLAYLAGYVLFLVPILPIAAKGAHYLYGSGLVFSIAIAALFMSEWANQRKAVLLVLASMVLVLSIHTLNIQRDMYRTGMCMNTASKTIESSYLANGSPEKMNIVVDDGASKWALLRYAHNREIIGMNHSLKMEVLDNTQITNDANIYRFNASCIVYKK
jgi:hypothetical protein